MGSQSFDEKGEGKHHFQIDISALQEGGPEVDDLLILGFIEGELSLEENQSIQNHIVTWYPWYRAYSLMIATREEVLDGEFEEDFDDPNQAFSELIDTTRKAADTLLFELIKRKPR